ncbi:hypothetical protein ACEWY4_007841 [Coilia grayii]|uniref:Hexosyltransferase n=1 Tax=Coilia grayii TaxID=363190 RepID=A0ABD1K984_9TELE
MKSYTRLIVVALVICAGLVILYSNLIVKEVNTRTDSVDTTVKTATTDLRTIHIQSRPVGMSRPHIRIPPPHVKISPIEVSPGFKSAIPQNTAFWNRKFYAGLKKLETWNVSQLGQSSTESTESLQANIPDFNSYPALYQEFLHSMHFRTPDLLINQPNKCESNGQPDRVTLLLGIKSVARNFEERQAIRETWGHEGLYEDNLLVRRVFLLGTPSLGDPDLRSLLALEAQQFGDLLVWDFKDSFYNLTLKEHVFLKWSLQHCSQASFIFKGDDDVFVNPKAVLSYVKSLDPEKASKLYAGQIISQASPHRSPNIKYFVPPSFYDGPYPPYAGGGGFIFSGALLQSLYSVTWLIPFYPIDDVYTGMCFQALAISPEKHSGFQTFDIREQDRDNPCVYRTLLVVHRRTPQQALRLWRSMNSPLLTC